MKLYAWDTCPYCRKVINFINSSALNVDIEYIGYDNESRKKIADMAGKFQVPVLEHNGEYLFESGDIIEYLKTVK